MVAASFNVNGVRARLQIVLDWLAAVQPDVLCLQETKVQDEDFPADQFAAASYHVAFHGQKSYNGVAILSKTPPEDVRTGFSSGAHADQARLISGRLGATRVVNTYVPQGAEVGSEKFAYKLSWLAELEQELAELLAVEEQVLWVGDMNIAPDDRDVFDPDKYRGAVGFHPDEHEALRKLAALGFEDVFRRHNQDGGEFTFWDYRLPASLKRNLGWRIDHIMASEGLAAWSRRCWIDREPRALDKPSDHTPICAEFDLQ